MEGFSLIGAIIVGVLALALIGILVFSSKKSRANARKHDEEDD